MLTRDSRGNIPIGHLHLLARFSASPAIWDSPEVHALYRTHNHILYKPKVAMLYSALSITSSHHQPRDSCHAELIYCQRDIIL